MLSPINKGFSKTVAGWLVSVSCAVAPLAVPAATNTFTFNNTTVNAGAGPSNPANGVTSISGANLNVGDVVVFDGIVIDMPGSTGDAWGSVNLNGGGYLGLVNANLGVLAETGTASGNGWQLFLNGTGTSTVFGSAALDSKTNRIHIELTCTEAGSTANMNYLVEIDQGVTGVYNDSLSGAGVTFANNIITLTFGANNAAHLFVQVQPIIAVSAPTPAINTVIAGSSATFAATLTQGYPLNTAQQWLSNGVPISGATGLTYITPPTTASFNGAQYSIVVTNLLTPGNVVTSSVALLVVRSGPGIVPFNFPTTTTVAGYGPVTDPGVAIGGSQLLAGDTVVFDGILTPNGAQLSDAWTAINIGGSGYGNFTTAQLGVLCRQGTGPSQLTINGSGSSNPTSGGALTNRVRIELYPSANGSTTNMGWLVEIDQNLSGTFLPAVTGTNLTFANNTLPLTFGSSGGSSFVYQDPQSPASIFSQPNPLQVVAVGAPVSEGVTVSGWYPAFQWRKNGTAIPNATNQIYTLAAATLADNGDQFTVVVSNRLDSLNVVTSTVANVSVLIPNNLSWYPTVDLTTWDIVTPNWTTNGGTSQADFASGNNVTFDTLGYNLGGYDISVTNIVNPNAVTVNVTGYLTYQLGGAGSINGQALHLTSADNSGTLGLQASASFATATIDAGSTLDVGYAGTDDLAFGANNITNNGTIDFQNAAGVLTVSSVITGSGSVIQDGSGTTILSATNSDYTIGAVNSGVLLIASSPNPGDILNDSELQPNSQASVLVIPNAVTGSGHYAFTGFQTTILTGLSSFTGANRLAWGPVIVDNPQALGDANAGYTAVTGADNLGGLYLSNNVTWTQPLELDPRLDTGIEASAPHVSNWNGTNMITSPLSFMTGQGGSEINVEAAAGQLTIDAGSTLMNNANANTNNLNLQGAATGIWNGVLADGSTALYVVKRGTGTWTLGGANTYSGNTTVVGGILLITNQSASTAVSVLSGATLGGNGAVLAGTVTVAAGGTLAPGLPSGNGTGALTINNNLALAPGSFTSMKLNKAAATNDIITGANTLTYGGTLVVSNLSGTLVAGNVFPLFSAAGYTGTFAGISPATPGSGLAWDTSTLAVDGKLRVVVGDTVATNVVPIVATVVGGNSLKLAWPMDHTGWTLEVQTNSLNAGLGTNWVRLTASTATNQVTLPIVPANDSVFYRLVY
jgi:autotransporter-associated beta strand protein